jgi:hypothetical protein
MEIISTSPAEAGERRNFPTLSKRKSFDGGKSSAQVAGIVEENNSMLDEITPSIILTSNILTRDPILLK